MSARTVTLTDFLLARIAEDEAVARREIGRRDVILTGAFAPERILADRQAKRLVVELHRGSPYPNPTDEPIDLECTGSGDLRYPNECRTLRALTLPYADHPDYDEAWRP